jgi:hypothetical protein
MKTRTASCCCGALTALVTADPEWVVACHCRECQRRTGSVLGVGAYFRKTQVQVTGKRKIFVREGQAGRKLSFSFCPTCGGTVLWELELRPDHLGIAVGAFTDPSFPPPTRSVWEDSRHHWIEFGHELARSARQAVVGQ